MTDTFTTIKPSPESLIPRDGWKRPLIVPPEGGAPVAYTRMTTYINCLEDKTNLHKWDERNILLGCVVRPDLLLNARAHSDPDAANDKRTLNQLCDEAKEAAAAHRKANIGTAYHRLTEDLDRGMRVDNVPPEVAADLAAYQSETAGLQVEHIETFRVLDELQAAGTADRVVRWQGRRYIADLKTGNVDYGMLKICMQLAGYANGIPYTVENGREPDAEPLDTERGILIHLPVGSGKCHLSWVDLRTGYAALQLARQIHGIRKLKAGDLSEPFTARDTSPIPALIASATTVEELGGIWQQYAHQWTPEHTALAAARKAAIS